MLKLRKHITVGQTAEELQASRDRWAVLTTEERRKKVKTIRRGCAALCQGYRENPVIDQVKKDAKISLQVIDSDGRGLTGLLYLKIMVKMILKHYSKTATQRPRCNLSCIGSM